MGKDAASLMPVLRGRAMTANDRADMHNWVRKNPSTIYAKRHQWRQVQDMLQTYGTENTEIVWTD